jgi:hypothetical protein
MGSTGWGLASGAVGLQAQQPFVYFTNVRNRDFDEKFILQQLV